MDSPRSALITGGSTGLGLATAHHLAGLGLGVTITGRTRSTLDTALAELRGRGRRRPGRGGRCRRLARQRTLGGRARRPPRRPRRRGGQCRVHRRRRPGRRRSGPVALDGPHQCPRPGAPGASGSPPPHHARWPDHPGGQCRRTDHPPRQPLRRHQGRGRRPRREPPSTADRVRPPGRPGRAGHHRHPVLGRGRGACVRLASTAIAEAVGWIVGQPAGVDVNELLVRPVGQPI